jgi:hypothetical protein
MVSSTHHAAAASSTAFAPTPNALAPTWAATASADSWDRVVSTTLPPAGGDGLGGRQALPLEAAVTIAAAACQV